MSVADAIQAFARELAAQDDPAKVKALLARAEMLALNMTEPEKFEAPISTLGDYLARELPVPPVLVEPALVVRGGIACTIGRAGKGKTQMNLNRVMRWACGEPLFPDLQTKDGVGILAPSGPLKVLVVENEGAPGMFHRQVGIMLNAEGFLTDEQRDLVRENVLIWGDGGYSGLKLDDQSQLDTVRSGCERWKPDILFIEPFRGLWQGDENSSTDMAKVADALSMLATEYDCGVILTHHERKSGAGDDGEKMSAGRGSTVLEGVVATMENFEVAKGGDYRELSWSKIRYGGGHPLLPIRMQWQPGAWWYNHVPLDAIEQVVLDALAASDEPMTIRDLCDETEEKDHQVRKLLKGLVEQGKVKKMHSQHTAGGSTGNRYRLIGPDTEGSGGSLEF